MLPFGYALPLPTDVYERDNPLQERAMLKDTVQLFDALVHFVRQHGYGEVYTRDPRARRCRQTVALCAFERREGCSSRPRAS